MLLLDEMANSFFNNNHSIDIKMIEDLVERTTKDPHADRRNLHTDLLLKSHIKGNNLITFNRKNMQFIHLAKADENH